MEHYTKALQLVGDGTSETRIRGIVAGLAAK